MLLQISRIAKIIKDKIVLLLKEQSLLKYVTEQSVIFRKKQFLRDKMQVDLVIYQKCLKVKYYNPLFNKQTAIQESKNPNEKEIKQIFEDKCEKH